MVRLAESGDAAEIARVHVATWRSAYRGLLADDFLESLNEAHYTERWKRVIGDGFSRVFVVDDPEGIVGFASGGRDARERLDLRGSCMRCTCSPTRAAVR